MRIFVKCGSKEPFLGRIAQDLYSSFSQGSFSQKSPILAGFSTNFAATSCSKLQHTAIISRHMQRSFAKIQEIDKIAAALNEYR